MLWEERKVKSPAKEREIQNSVPHALKAKRVDTSLFGSLTFLLFFSCLFFSPSPLLPSLLPLTLVIYYSRLPPCPLLHLHSPSVSLCLISLPLHTHTCTHTHIHTSIHPCSPPPPPPSSSSLCVSDGAAQSPTAADPLQQAYTGVQQYAGLSVTLTAALICV